MASGFREVRFSCTRLPTGVVGLNPPDEFGYYTQPIGGLNCYNSAGCFYRPERAVQLFTDEHSSFNRRIQKGVLEGEVDHPRYEAGMSKEDYFRRLEHIEKTRVCVHWLQISLDFNNYRTEDGQPFICILGKFRPGGAYGYALKDALDNPKQNVYFSIRSFTDDVVIGGVRNKDIIEAVTWDWVTEGGILTANKYEKIGLESYSSRTDADEDVIFTEADLRAIKNHQIPGVGTESEGSRLADILLRQMGLSGSSMIVPNWAKEW
jgi:hypothetical protein